MLLRCSSGAPQVLLRCSSGAPQVEVASKLLILKDRVSLDIDIDIDVDVDVDGIGRFAQKSHQVESDILTLLVAKI